MKIERYKPEYKQAFHDLTIAWLTKYFTVEPVHKKLLDDPEGAIIMPGGEIFFALTEGRVIGTVAIRALGEGRFELTKLGVDASAQGLGAGRALCRAVIDWFVGHGGKTLFLETHSKLAAALHLYQLLGFKVCDNPAADGYDGTDLYMEWHPMSAQRLVEVTAATSSADIAAAKEIFRAFAKWLPIDLGFQDFEGEMASFPEGFVHLLVAKRGDEVLGAVGLKGHSADVCEMKRLFVLPSAQGIGAGRLLCEKLLKDAKSLGYSTMLLDSLGRLEAAVALYRKLGFTEIAPYNFNPEPDVVYMSRTL